MKKPSTRLSGRGSKGAIAASARRSEGLRVSRVLEACLYADDLEAAQSFYTEVLGLSVFLPPNGRDVFFRCGDTMVLIFNPERTRISDSDVPTHGASGPGHMAFAIPESDLQSWRQHLQVHAVQIEREVRWPGGGHSIYFRDPAGNSLELATPAVWSKGTRSLSE